SSDLGAHRRSCLVQHPQKGASLLLLAERLAQLQVPSRRTVQHHVFSSRIRGDMSEVGQRIFLRLEQILKKRTGADDTAVIVGKPQSCKGRHLEMIQQLFPADGVVKIPCVKRKDRSEEQ